MDIYSFINSRDIAAHCREINYTWNPFDMAVIIAISSKPVTEKITAWRELINDYPDMPTPAGYHHKSYPSLHKKLTEAIADNDDSTRLFSDDFCVIIPTPFKRGDILTYAEKWTEQNDIFVLDSIDYYDPYQFERRKRYEGDRTDMIGWGLYIADDGTLYGNHSLCYDCYEYYRGKLDGKYSLLHYVSLYLKGEIELPELLVTQCRCVLQNLLDNSLCTGVHGCHITEHLDVKYRLNGDEEKELKESNGLLPYVSKKLSVHQVEFLMKEFGGDIKTIQAQLRADGGFLLGQCAGIVHDENYYQRINYSKFNYDRRAMAKMILESYGCTEDGWVDSHADN